MQTQETAKDTSRNDLDFEEVETPDADTVTLGNASYTKMVGRIFAA